MADIAPENGARDHRREQHLGVEPVLVLLLDPLLSRAGARGVRHLEPEGLPRSLGAAGTQIEKIRLQQPLSFDHLSVAAIRQMHGARGAVAVFFRYSVHPALG